MSCANPETDTNATMPRRRKYDKSQDCVRCKVARGNIVIRHAVYCKECFFPLIGYKFRRSLEPFVNHKPDGPRRAALKSAGNLLLGFSGGLGSTVLLDLVHQTYISLDNIPVEGGRDHPRHERVWPKVTVCYVEVCEAFPGMKDRTDQIADAIAQRNGVEFRALRVQDAFDREWWKRAHARCESSQIVVDLSTDELLLSSLTDTSSSSSPLELLRSYLASLPTATAVTSTVQTLIRLLLLHTAVETSSSHLVLGTSLTSLAVSLISGVAQGRGFTVREQLQEEWFPDNTSNTDVARHGSEGASGVKAKGRTRRSVRVVRPLRDVGMKECAAWAWWKGLWVVGKEKWQWPGAKLDISALTKDFVVGLEKDYPSTVSTIVRTCGKLAPKGEMMGRCVVCERPVQQGVQEWKSRISIRSRPPPGGNAGEPTASVSSAASVAPSLAPYLCYACHTTLTSKSSRAAPPLYPDVGKTFIVPLPVWFGSQLPERDAQRSASRMSQEEMRSVVSEFLLE